MAKTIKELSEICGVSEQAIRKWCARNQVTKDVAQHYEISETIETAILRHYGKNERNQVAKHSETCETVSETTKDLIEMLKKELKAKDRQIKNLQKQNESLTQALQNTTESLKAAQVLQANSEQKLQLLEQKEVAATEEAPTKKHWWNRKK